MLWLPGKNCEYSPDHCAQEMRAPLGGRLTGGEESPISKSPPRTEKREEAGGLTAPGQMSRLARLLGNGNVFGQATRTEARRGSLTTK